MEQNRTARCHLANIAALYIAMFLNKWGPLTHLRKSDHFPDKQPSDNVLKDNIVFNPVQTTLKREQ